MKAVVQIGAYDFKVVEDVQNLRKLLAECFADHWAYGLRLYKRVLGVQTEVAWVDFLSRHIIVSQCWLTVTEQKQIINFVADQVSTDLDDPNFTLEFAVEYHAGREVIA